MFDLFHFILFFYIVFFIYIYLWLYYGYKCLCLTCVFLFFETKQQLVLVDQQRALFPFLPDLLLTVGRVVAGEGLVMDVELQELRDLVARLRADNERLSHWLQLRAANGLAIPYIGYLELDVELCEKQLPACGILVVKDPPGGVLSQGSGVLGMNVIRRCYGELFGQHGLGLFNLPAVSEGPKPVKQALQKCHEVGVTADQGAGKAKLRCKKACRIPGGVMKIAPATCSEQYSGTTMLFEPLDSGLPAGLLASPALVSVVRGTAYIPIVNVGASHVLLHPHVIVGTLEEV